jgi:AcrR family transcriptional regulator
VNEVSTQKRRYQLKARAERQRRTRERIVAATAALHEEVGPARTTIADIARRAGVQRLTVYKTFPDPAQLFAACQGHFLAQSPPPDLDPDAGDPRARLEQALTALYGWFRANQAMQRHVHRDRHLVPDLDRLLEQTLDARFDALARAYADRLGGDRTPLAAQALIRLALDFRTWELLSGLGLEDRGIARLLARAAGAVLDQCPEPEDRPLPGGEGGRDGLHPEPGGPAASSA